VPIVDDPEFHVVIGDIQPAKLRRHGIRQIDRRLLQTELARLEGS
jgi:hypothetical protein